MAQSSSSLFNDSSQAGSSPSIAPASALQPLDLEKELSCSICTEILYQPLTLLDCLHTFCGSCLKEWFGWQAKAAESQPRHTSSAVNYTCPSCRAPVRETRPNATVTTLLEMYLRANPGKAKSETERKEIAEKYSPSEGVLPVAQTTTSSRVGRQTQAQLEEEEDQRLLQEVRELSLREAGQSRSRRTSRDRVRAGQPRHRHRRHESNTRSRRNDDTSPHEAARRELESQLRARGGLRAGESLRSLEHQGSLRTLMSRSGAGSDVSNAVQGDIMREILEGNLLDELDFSHIDEGDQEAVSELIARAYLEKRQRRGHRANSSTGQPDNRQVSAQTTSDASTAPPVTRPHLLDVNTPDRRERSSHGRSSSQASSRSATQRDVTRPSSGNLAAVPGTSGQGDDGARDRSSARRRGRRRASDDRQPTENREAQIEAYQAFTNNTLGTHDVPDAKRALPSLTCDNCSRPDISQRLHYTCIRCCSSNEIGNPSFTLCHHCYKTGRGCNHWYGFGAEAHKNYVRTAPPGGWPRDHQPPHLMQAGRYNLAGPNESALQHQTGLFCHICQSNANTCYWHCDHCNSGEYGFCNTCVNQARHCTHPLQALYTVTEPSASSTSPTSPSSTQQGNKTHLHPLPIHTTCNACTNPIPPSTTRFHCPTCNGGDYDICSACYGSLLSTGAISSQNGPRGWRKCPSGHRMLVIGFEGAAGSLRRVVVEGVVGGWRVREEDTGASTSAAAAASNGGERADGAGVVASERSPEAGFTWRDSKTGSWKHKRGVSQSADPRGPGMPFVSASASYHTTSSSASAAGGENIPPAADHTTNMVAIWARIPDEGPGHEDELEFPKGAVISEVVTINETWAWGVYCRRGGLFPEAFGRVVR